jgi:CheY-like chemotaxis protein
MSSGAVGYLQKPTSKEELERVLSKLDKIVESNTRNLLVVEKKPENRRAITELIGNDEIEIDEADSGESALEMIKNKHHDCIILDLDLPDMDGNTFLEKIATDHKIDIPPVVIYSDQKLSRDQTESLHNHSNSIIIKDVRSEERLLDEATLFLHRVIADLPDSKRERIERLYNTDELLKGKKIMVVDDDMRALFALTRVLSEHGMNVIKAEGGERALELLNTMPDIDLILMDIMMPGLDGYQTMQLVRNQEQFISLPIIALTAKAMPEDRQLCLDAGANDYMTKPIDPTNLVSLLRVWLYR